MAKESVSEVVHALKLNSVNTILIGHGHYDHAFDVPFLLERDGDHAPTFENTTVYVNQTTLGMICANDPGLIGEKCQRVKLIPSEAIEHCVDYSIAQRDQHDSAPRCKTTQKPIDLQFARGKVEFRALSSMHTPHISFPRITFASGSMGHVPRDPPRRYWSWQSGQNFSFVVDFYSDADALKYRVYLLDSIIDLPCLVCGNYQVAPDVTVVAVVPVAGWKKAKNEHEVQLKHLNPDFVLLNHWDNFLQPHPLVEGGRVISWQPGITQEFMAFVEAMAFEDGKVVKTILRHPGAPITFTECGIQ
ncbi:MAG: MBL fold metallo-hydrolase [Pseudomonadota bacterium]